MVIISEPNKLMGGELGAFGKLYGLTNAETLVLTHLLQQRNTNEIAEALQISIHTLRTHLKAMFAKTCTRNQRELVNFCRSHPMVEG
jgi:DNA-binding CsgD family transcriptional regulator